MRFVLLLVLALGWPAPSIAQLQKVESASAFLALVSGKVLTRPFIKLEVGDDGFIIGKGGLKPVTGRWVWQDGYFCRDLNWGGDALGYNCQEVRAEGNRIQFRSDRGQGQSATFTLR